MNQGKNGNARGKHQRNHKKGTISLSGEGERSSQTGRKKGPWEEKRGKGRGYPVRKGRALPL